MWLGRVSFMLYILKQVVFKRRYRDWVSSPHPCFHLSIESGSRCFKLSEIQEIAGLIPELFLTDRCEVCSRYWNSSVSSWKQLLHPRGERNICPTFYVFSSRFQDPFSCPTSTPTPFPPDGKGGIANLFSTGSRKTWASDCWWARLLCIK